jgi:TatD DNase family protein
MAPILIDTHTHLYSDEFATDIDAVITRAQQDNVQKFYLPAIDSNSLEAMLALEKKYPGVCISMMGLHPCYVKKNVNDELAIVEKWINDRDFVAIGEIGLDFYWDKTFVEQQRKAFETQMEWALAKNWPIVIHTRNAMQETIEMVKPFAKRGLRGIFHCFSGSKESAEQIIGMGFHLGLGGVLTYKNAGVAEAVKDIPMEYLVLETDAPYLAPVPYRGKTNEPAYMIEVAKKLADIKSIPLHEIAAITTSNAEKLFGLGNA